MLDISNHTEPNFTEFVFPIFLMAFNSGTCNNIQVINDTVVKETICDVLNFLIFSCSIFSKLFFISKFYPHLFLIS